MTEFTAQRDKDVRVLIDYDNSTFYTMTVRELMERAWELGHAYAKGYGMDYPEGSTNESSDEEFYGDTGKKFL